MTTRELIDKLLDLEAVHSQIKFSVIVDGAKIGADLRTVFYSVSKVDGGRVHIVVTADDKAST